MNQLDRFYRGLIDYRKQTVGDYDCDRLRGMIASANAQDDVVELNRKICTVEQEWISEIEKGLTHIEKAIREERQFIRSNGEVVPIEKVKRVDKESVAHLARHSNLLTKEPPEGMDIIPDELYTVERLSDYAVYENRFLYMLLCYLRDFITLRYDKILELATTYNGSLSMNKLITHRKQKITCEIKLVEQRKNDAYLMQNNEAKDSLSRIDSILKAVIHYLNTPLMEEVGKTPMLKPPITKTNVLKMNNNFKGCMALYEYVTAYNKPGYTVEDYHKKMNPLPDLPGDEFAEATSLLSFLTYEHSMGLHEYLREEYNQEEARRKEEENQKLVEQIRNLKKRIRESGLSPEEYMLLLEKRNKMLESDSAQLVIAKQEIERLNGEVEALTENVANLEQEVQSLKDEIVEINARHEREMAELKEKHEKEIAALLEKHAREIETLKQSYEKQIADIKEAREREIKALINSYEEKKAALVEKYEGQIEELKCKHQEEIAALNELRAAEIRGLTKQYTEQKEALEQRNEADRKEFAKTLQEKEDDYTFKEAKLRAEWATETVAWKELLGQKDVEIAALEQKCEETTETCRLTEARMNVMRFEYGLIQDKDEFLSQTSFDELEHQYRLLKKLFNSEWAKVKKDIRTRFVWKLFKKDKTEENSEETENSSEGNEFVSEQAEIVSEEKEILPEQTENTNQTNGEQEGKL